MPQRDFGICLLGFVTFLLLFARSTGENVAQHGRGSMDKTTTDKMESQMLRILGLTKRPRPKENATAPQFMWDMYNLMNHNSEQVAGMDRDGSKDCIYLDPSIPGNIVRSFPCKVRRSRSIVRTSYQANWVIEFNLSSITPTEKLTGAHLRLESLINLRAKTLVDYFQLSISSIPREEKTTKTNVLFKDLVSNHTSDATKVGVDVLPLVQFWRNDLEAKHVINITVHCLSTVLKSQCDRFISKMHRPAQQFTNLVTVSMEGERCKGRSKRSSQNNKRDPPVKELSDACQRHSLYVGFREVGWDDWIIAPTGYQAYYCAGECIFPIGEQQNGTNHAVIQTLVSRLDYESVPDVCCAPVRLSPISLLFFDDDENVVLRRYDDMIVESCGCR